MSIQAEADLILKLYELRREPVMREARDWYIRNFFPTTVADYDNAMRGPHSGHIRMVVSYWDMAAAFVNHGAISLDFFSDTNGEHIGVFSRIEPILADIRSAWGPHAFASLEKLIDAVPEGRRRSADMRERMKQIMAEMQKQHQAAQA